MPTAWKPSHPAFEALIAAMLAEVSPIYVVGGVVRDHLLGRTAKVSDLDLAVYENAIAISRRVADRLGWAFYAMDEVHDVGRLVFMATGAEPLVCDVASMRGRSKESDLLSRDFTINAMAFGLHVDGTIELIDVVGGQQDLAARLVRRVAPTSLVDDPIRLLRAVRFAVEFDLEIEIETSDQIERLADTVQLASPERTRDELWKMLCTLDADHAIDQMATLGLLRTVLPEVSGTMDVAQSPPHYLDVYQHTLQTMRQAVEIREWLKTNGKNAPVAGGETVSWQTALQPWRAQLQRHFMQTLSSGRLRADWLVWFALLHDIGKPSTRSEETVFDAMGVEGVRYRFFDHESVGATMATERLTFLRFSRGEIELTRRVIGAHMRPHHLHAAFAHGPISRRALYRAMRDVGGPVDGPAMVDVAMLALADIQATYASEPPAWTRYLDQVTQIIAYAFDDQGQYDVRRRPLVDGHTLMSHLGMEPGPDVGRLLGQLLEAQAAGDITTAEEALMLARGLQEGMDELPSD